MTADLPEARGDFCPWLPGRTQTPTAIERELFRRGIDFAAQAKYPIRRNAVLSPDQLAAARAQLGPAGFGMREGASTRDADRRPLTAEELRVARARAGSP
jgi:hypothetical protein